MKNSYILQSTDMAEMLEHIPAIVFRLSHVRDNWHTIYVTQNISMYGYTRDEFLSGEMTWLKMVHPDDMVLLNKNILDYEAQNIKEFRLYYRIVTKNGDSISVTEYNTLTFDETSGGLIYDTVIINISAPLANLNIMDNYYRKQIVLNDILLSLHDSDLNHALQIILDRTGEYLDTSRTILFKDSPDHKTCKVIYEWDNKYISSMMDLDYSIAYETSMPEIYVALQTTGSLLVNFGEIPKNCKEEFEAEGLVASAIFAVYLNGEYFGFVCFDDCVIARTWDEDTVHFLKNISNLISTIVARQHTTEQLAQSQSAIERMAFTDYLTKLPNRFSCDHELQTAINGASKVGKSDYLLFIDMDDFKIVNDCYGHDYGDAILISLANWLHTVLLPPHRVFRFGGDEFVVLLDYNETMDLESILTMLHDRTCHPWKSLDKEFYCTLSIGVVRYPSEDLDSRTVIKQADIALYEAKRLGKNQHYIYDNNLDVFSQERTFTEALLRKAMKNNFKGFEVFYQPIVDAKTGHICGSEALLRIKDGDKIVTPKDFLSLAEYLRFIVPIGEFVLEKAIEECKHINENGFPDFKMTVNMSYNQIKQKDVLARLEKVLQKVDVDYNNVIISISESTALQNPERIAVVCGHLCDIGISVMLDDFCGGSASLLQLSRLPVAMITTSISLIENINYAKEFIHLIIHMCHSMDKQVCINGIEDDSQLYCCKKNKADKLQGFYLYHVGDAATLKKLLSQQTS